MEDLIGVLTDRRSFLSRNQQAGRREGGREGRKKERKEGRLEWGLHCAVYQCDITTSGRCEFVLHPRFSPLLSPLLIRIIQITVLFPDLRLAHPLPPPPPTSVRIRLVGVIYRTFQKFRMGGGMLSYYTHTRVMVIEITGNASLLGKRYNKGGGAILVQSAPPQCFSPICEAFFYYM